MNPTFKVDVQLDFEALRHAGDMKRQRVVTAVATQFARLSVPYVPYRSGDLFSSELVSSRYEDGLVIWDTYYARHVYDMDASTTNFTRNIHPNATSHWAEVVLSKYSKDLLSLADRIVKGEA